MSEDKTPPKEPPPPPLSNSAKWNLAVLFLAYASVICMTTLVVGNSAIVVKSVGGSNDIAPTSLAMFVLGAAMVSLVTAKLFEQGRKFGFIVGTLFGLSGAGLGAIAIWIKSAALVIVSSLPLGAAQGIGMYLRFAAVEVVPPHKKAFAVTLVLSGGFLAAFAGPETSLATRDMFGQDLLFMGTFLMIAVFNILDLFFVLLAKFPEEATKKEEEAEDMDDEEEQDTTEHDSTVNQVDTTITVKSILSSRAFWVLAILATFGWAIMAMPMSIAPVAMQELQFSGREALLTIELHFLGMYSLGLLIGRLIGAYGPLVVSAMGCASFTIGFISGFTAGKGTLALWILSLFFYGIGWNLTFSSATVMLTQSYQKRPDLKKQVQAANDFIMFFLSGALIFSTGYMYQAGGGELGGWRTINYSAVALVILMFLWIVAEFHHQRMITKSEEQPGYQPGTNTKESGVDPEVEIEKEDLTE